MEVGMLRSRRELLVGTAVAAGLAAVGGVASAAAPRDKGDEVRFESGKLVRVFPLREPLRVDWSPGDEPPGTLRMVSPPIECMAFGEGPGEGLLAGPALAGTVEEVAASLHEVAKRNGWGRVLWAPRYLAPPCDCCSHPALELAARGYGECDECDATFITCEACSWAAEHGVRHASPPCRFTAEDRARAQAYVFGRET